MAVWVFSPGLSEEASLASSLIWPGRSGLGARPCASPPPPPLRAGGHGWSPGTLVLPRPGQG